MGFPKKAGDGIPAGGLAREGAAIPRTFFALLRIDLSAEEREENFAPFVPALETFTAVPERVLEDSLKEDFLEDTLGILTLESFIFEDAPAFFREGNVVLSTELTDVPGPLVGDLGNPPVENTGDSAISYFFSGIIGILPAGFGPPKRFASMAFNAPFRDSFFVAIIKLLLNNPNRPFSFSRRPRSFRGRSRSLPHFSPCHFHQQNAT